MSILNNSRIRVWGGFALAAIVLFVAVTFLIAGPLGWVLVVAIPLLLGVSVAVGRLATGPAGGALTWAAIAALGYRAVIDEESIQRDSGKTFAIPAAAKDEAVVAKWVEDQSWKTEYICLNIPDAPKLATMEDVEKRMAIPFTSPGMGEKFTSRTFPSSLFQSRVIKIISSGYDTQMVKDVSLIFIMLS